MQNNNGNRAKFPIFILFTTKYLKFLYKYGTILKNNREYFAIKGFRHGLWKK